MGEEDRFIRYRARLRRPVWPKRLWGKELLVYEWTYYEASVVKSWSWLKRWVKRWGATTDRETDLEGTFDGVHWLPVSHHLIEEWRKAEIGARAAADVAGGRVDRPAMASDEELAEEIQRVIGLCAKRPGKGEAAFHLVRHLRVDADRVAGILQRAGHKEVKGWNVDDLVKYGKRRKGSCRFCDLSR